MQDSLQAYYTARGEVELGKLAFQKESGTIQFPSDPTKYSNKRINIDPDSRIRGGDPITLKSPDIGPSKISEHVVIAEDLKLPLSLYLYENDAMGQSFGTSKGDPTSHILNTFGGGVTFDLSGIDTGGGFSLSLLTAPSLVGKIAMEFVFSSATDDNPFFGTIPLDTSGKTDLMKTSSSVGSLLGQNFLAGQNCRTAHCYMKIRLSESALGSIAMQLSSDRVIPDINAVLIADALSKNSLYHARIIELLPVTQSI